MSDRITLSVVSHGQGALVDALLTDLARIAPPQLARIVLTRNLPEDRHAPAPMQPPVTVIQNAVPKGFAANHNAAFAHCDTPYFAVVNPDVRLAEDPFPALVRALQDPCVALAAPGIVDAAGRRADHARGLVTPLEILRRAVGAPPPAPAHPAWLAGMFLVFRSEVYGRLGGFDEGYRLYCEDVDLCARLRLAGYGFRVVDEAQVVHEAQRTSHRSLRYLNWHLRSLLRWWTSASFHRYRRLLAAEARAGSLS